MKLWKKTFTLLGTILLAYTAIWCCLYQDKVYIFYRDHILKERAHIVIVNNEYFKDKDYLYVQNTNDFIAKDKDQIYDIIYTIINSGTDEFTFYCDDDYTTCLDDVNNIITNQVVLSNINNFVHPFNSFEEIQTSYTTRGNVTLEIVKNYSNDDINKLNTKVDEVINKNITTKMSDKDKIKTIHNYIINNSKYISADDSSNPDHSKATGILLNGSGLCSGYSDAMALFLERFKIDNYKIASENHVWNLVNVNNKWLHLDLTWDDPVTSDGSNRLEMFFFLIDNNRLHELNVDEHSFDSSIYQEAK